MDVKKELGEKIKRLRKQRGLTREKFAEMADISVRNLSSIENGSSFVRSETLNKILTSLNTTTQELFSNDHIKPNDELVKAISHYVNLAKDNNALLERIYKVVRVLVEEEYS